MDLGDRGVVGLEARAPVGDDVVVGEVHPAHAGQHGADAVAGDDRHPDLTAGGFEHPARRERLEAVPSEPAVQLRSALRLRLFGPSFQ